MFFSDEINKNNQVEVEEIKSYLDENEVAYDYPDKTFVIRDKGRIIATGSADGNILKYFFSREEYKGQGAMAIIYNSLLSHLLEEGHDSFFVFTTPQNTLIFESLGLKLVYKTERVALFEGGFYNYAKWIKKVRDQIGEIGEGERLGSIVMNCNPMTLGHKYLIMTAREQVDKLLIFIVEEDKSIFPFKDRYEIVKEELSQYNNIIVVKGGPYIISRGTFPTYFIKKKDEMLDIYTELDGKIFADKIAKDLNIRERFFGTEPRDVVTLAYNNSLKEILQSRNIEVDIIGRKEVHGDVISASIVRRLIEDNQLDLLGDYLPKTTLEYLKGERGQRIIEKIRAKEEA